MSIYERIRRILAGAFGVSEDAISPTTTLAELAELANQRPRTEGEPGFLDDLSMDSLNRIEFVMALEEELGLEITDEDAEELFRPDTTVEEIVRFIEGKPGS